MNRNFSSNPDAEFRERFIQIYGEKYLASDAGLLSYQACLRYLKRGDAVVLGWKDGLRLIQFNEIKYGSDTAISGKRV